MESSMERLQELTERHQAIVEESLGRLEAAMEQFRAIAMQKPSLQQVEGEISWGEKGKEVNRKWRELVDRFIAMMEEKKRQQRGTQEGL